MLGRIGFVLAIVLYASLAIGSGHDVLADAICIVGAIALAADHALEVKRS